MNLFKVGDKVKIDKNESSSCNKPGDVGVITEISSSTWCRVFVEGRSNCGNGHYFSDLKLIDEESQPIWEF